MSIGLGILKSVCERNVPVSDIYEAGISEPLFLPDELPVWSFVMGFHADNAAWPTFDTIRNHTGSDVSNMADEPFSYWTNLIKRRRVLTLSREMMSRMDSQLTRRGIDADMEEIILGASRFLSEATAISGNRILTLSDVSDEILSEHDHKRENPWMSGVSFGFPYLDLVSDGMQSGDLIVIVGRPGKGKSFVMAHMWNTAYDSGHSPLVVTMEMPMRQQGRRTLALRTRISPNHMKRGTLDEFGRGILGNEVTQLKENGRFMWFADRIRTVSKIRSLLRDLGARIGFVDGGYILSSEKRVQNREERISEIIKELKDTAMNLNIPIVVSFQLNRDMDRKKGPAKVGNIMYADSIGQFASVVLSMRDEEPKPGMGTRITLRQTKIIDIIKGREGEHGSIEISWDMRRTQITQQAVLDIENN